MTDSRATWLVQAGECVGVELRGQTAVLYLLILLFPKHVCGEVPGHSLLHELVKSRPVHSNAPQKAARLDSASRQARAARLSAPYV